MTCKNITNILPQMFFISPTVGWIFSYEPDKSGQRRTNSDTPCRPSKYSIFSRYLWAGLFP